MSVLRGLSRTTQALIVAAYAFSAGAALALWWTQLWSNVLADWVTGAPAVVAASGLLARHVRHDVVRRLDDHREQIAVGVAQQLAEHHEAVVSQIDRALATQPPQDGGRQP